MKQSRVMSLVDAVANVIVGYGVAVVTQILCVISVQQIMVQEIVIAAPVIGANRQAVAAISMPVYIPEWDEERVRRELVPAITDASRTISSIVALS